MDELQAALGCCDVPEVSSGWSFKGHVGSSTHRRRWIDLFNKGTLYYDVRLVLLLYSARQNATVACMFEMKWWQGTQIITAPYNIEVNFEDYRTARLHRLEQGMELLEGARPFLHAPTA